VKLLLVRHAISEDRDPARWPDDAERPLTQRGIKRFRRAARGLGNLVPEVDRLLTSPYVRAHQTATILEDELDWPAPEIRPHLEAGAPIAGAVALLAECGAGETVAAVGHEPSMSLLASAYVSMTAAELQLDWRRGGVALIEFDGSPAVNAGTLRWFAPPRVLRALED
jgi:phosphohistidine phosphatase